VFVKGQYDMICNHIGVETSLEALQWKGAKDFALSTPAVWMVGGETAGYVRSFGSLSLLLVLNSGHMVPLDKPVEALDMITRFIRQRAFADSKGGISPRSSVSDIVQDSALLPPVIEEPPLPGNKMVAVSFIHNREANVHSSGGVESGSGRYIVTSSPHGVTAEGLSSPIVVKGLVNGVAYTFSVVSEVHEASVIRTSIPSAGSVAVTPGCGAALSDDLVNGRSLLVDRGEEENSAAADYDSMELSLTQATFRVGCRHGVCATDGEKDRCLCFPGYTGEDCSRGSKL